MKEFGTKIFFYKMEALRSLIFFSDINFDIFKKLSGVIFSVHLILPNVADCYLKDHLHRFYWNLVFKTKVC